MKSVGQKFKTARESQKLSITEISMATKISPKVLQSMEDGNLSQLPALSFLRGFVKTYASYLKLDAEDLLVEFQKEYDEEMTPSIEVHSPGAYSEPSKAASTGDLHFIKEKSSTHLWLAAIGLVVLIGVVIGVNEVVEKYKKEATLVSPPEDLERIEGLEQELPEATVQAEPDSETLPDTNSAAVESNKSPSKVEVPIKPIAPAEDSESTKVSTTTQLPVQAPANPAAAPQTAPAPAVVPPALVQAQTPAPTVAPAPAAAAPKVETPVAPPAEVKPKSDGGGAAQEVILEALDRVVVTFKINEGPTEKVTLFPDQVHTIKLRGKVALDFSDGGAINVIVNGRDRGVPGDLGKPKKVTFP